MDLSCPLTSRMRLRSPVIAASGTFGYGTDLQQLTDRTALGAIVSKGVTLRSRQGTAPPRIVETPSGMLNAIGLQNPGVEAVIREYAPLWATWEVPVLVNINGSTVEEYAQLASLLDGVPGVSGLEINISCPNLKAGGVEFGRDPRAAAQVTASVRAATHLPLVVKLAPNVSDIVAVATAVVDEGADAISAVNTFFGMSMDLATGRPRLANVTGGLSGPAIRPAALYLAHKVACEVSVPVIGIGGISRADDALEFLLAGCSAVQVGTATFTDPRSMALVHDGIRRYLVGRGLTSLEALPRYHGAAGPSIG